MFKKSVLFVFALVCIIFVLTGCQCEHEWTEATCHLPKTCSKCGETEGAALEHKWSEATCKTPSTCSLCKKTRGTVAEHKWSSVSLEEPSKCSVCRTVKPGSMALSTEYFIGTYMLEELGINGKYYSADTLKKNGYATKAVFNADGTCEYPIGASLKSGTWEFIGDSATGWVYVINAGGSTIQGIVITSDDTPWEPNSLVAFVDGRTTTNVFSPRVK